MPASDVRDNEYVPGHLTGYNFLALSGLKLAVAMANETGHPDRAKAWQAEYDDYRAAFFKVLDAQAAAHNGYIPPALDGQKGGYDWGNMLAVVPEPTLDPHDPRVTATLKATQAKYAEGIMTYADGEFLHHYLTIKNTMTESHPGRSGAGGQRTLRPSGPHQLNACRIRIRIDPWGDRNFADNLAPHGWFAAEYRTLLRTMLVREEGDQLASAERGLAGSGSAKARQSPSARLPLISAPSRFTLDQPDNGEAVLHLNSNFTGAPKQIVLHLPWFIELTSATMDGKRVDAANGKLVVPSNAKEIRMHWVVKSDTPHLSYEAAVDAYKAEYAQRYNKLMHGESAPSQNAQ